ncbi:MAG: DUF3256 family protein [Bacteroidaceae bacterium]|nr:DUF3256 family protein [Bacteroidaceae bacterium]MBP9637272.1 DUF3256 family protein [Bacteroidaceae bacterium]
MNFKTLSLIGLLSIGSNGILHAQTAKEAFLAMPDSLLPYLTANNKLDMPDFLASKMPARVKNKLEQTTEMKQLTADYLFLQTGENSSFQLKVLPLSSTSSIGKSLIAVIYSVSAPATDSQISFYTNDWKKKLPTESYFTQPSFPLHLKDTLSLEMRTRIQEILSIPFTSLKFVSENSDLLVNDSRLEYLDDESKALIAPYYTPATIKLSWQNGAYR